MFIRALSGSSGGNGYDLDNISAGSNSGSLPFNMTCNVGDIIIAWGRGASNYKTIPANNTGVLKYNVAGDDVLSVIEASATTVRLKEQNSLALSVSTIVIPKA